MLPPVSPARVWQFRVSRFLGRMLTWSAAILTLGRMPPFVSTSAVVSDGDNLLAVIDPGRRQPVLPGGHLKWREVPERAVVREVQEETGYLITVRRLIGVFAGEPWIEEPGVVRVLYEAVTAGGALTSSAEGEAVWLPVEQFLVMSERDAAIVRYWRDQRANPL